MGRGRLDVAVASFHVCDDMLMYLEWNCSDAADIACMVFVQDVGVQIFPPVFQVNSF